MWHTLQIPKVTWPKVDSWLTQHCVGGTSNGTCVRARLCSLGELFVTTKLIQSKKVVKVFSYVDCCLLWNNLSLQLCWNHAKSSSSSSNSSLRLSCGTCGAVVLVLFSVGISAKRTWQPSRQWRGCKLNSRYRGVKGSSLLDKLIVYQQKISKELAIATIYTQLKIKRETRENPSSKLTCGIWSILGETARLQCHRRRPSETKSFF